MTAPLVPLLAINPYLQGLLVVLFLLVSLLLILIVLIQRPSGGGLSGAFGSGSGSGQTAFGTKTGDALTIATIILFTVFVVGAIVLNFTTRPPKAVGQVEPVAESTGPVPSDVTTVPMTPSTPPATAPIDGSSVPVEPATAPAGQPEAAPAASPEPVVPLVTPPASTGGTEPKH